MIREVGELRGLGIVERRPSPSSYGKTLERNKYLKMTLPDFWPTVRAFDELANADDRLIEHAIRRNGKI